MTNGNAWGEKILAIHDTQATEADDGIQNDSLWLN